MRRRSLALIAGWDARRQRQAAASGDRRYAPFTAPPLADADLPELGHHPHHNGRRDATLRRLEEPAAVIDLPTAPPVRLVERLATARPPTTIPVRTDLERMCRAWTAPELEAIEHELRAGR